MRGSGRSRFRVGAARSVSRSSRGEQALFRISAARSRRTTDSAEANGLGDPGLDRLDPRVLVSTQARPEGCAGLVSTGSTRGLRWSGLDRLDPRVLVSTGSTRGLRWSRQARPEGLVFDLRGSGLDRLDPSGWLDPREVFDRGGCLAGGARGGRPRIRSTERGHERRRARLPRKLQCAVGCVRACGTGPCRRRRSRAGFLRRPLHPRSRRSQW